MLALSSGLCLDVVDTWEDACQVGSRCDRKTWIDPPVSLKVSHNSKRPDDNSCPNLVKQQSAEEMQAEAAERGFCRWLDGYKGSDWVLATWTMLAQTGFMVQEYLSTDGIGAVVCTLGF